MPAVVITPGVGSVSVTPTGLAVRAVAAPTGVVVGRPPMPVRNAITSPVVAYRVTQVWLDWLTYLAQGVDGGSA